MKTLRILIPVLCIPFFVSAMVADAIDQGSIVTRTLQVSSLTDELDLLCDKTKLSIALSGPPESARPFLARQYTTIQESAARISPRILLPYFLRAPPLF
jgi:hypothetical protein